MSIVREDLRGELRGVCAGYERERYNAKILNNRSSPLCYYHTEFKRILEADNTLHCILIQVIKTFNKLSDEDNLEKLATTKNKSELIQTYLAFMPEDYIVESTRYIIDQVNSNHKPSVVQLKKTLDSSNYPDSPHTKKILLEATGPGDDCNCPDPPPMKTFAPEDDSNSHPDPPPTATGDTFQRFIAYYGDENQLDNIISLQ